MADGRRYAGDILKVKYGVRVASKVGVASIVLARRFGRVCDDSR